MSLKDAILADASAVFCNTSDFAEVVTYHPHRYFGQAESQPRQINAVVVREEIDVFSESDGDSVLPVFQVHVTNSDTTGVASTEVDLGGDQFEFAGRDGKAAERVSVVKMSEHDNGMLVLVCR